jgi:hypothetical protein
MEAEANSASTQQWRQARLQAPVMENVIIFGVRNPALRRISSVSQVALFICGILISKSAGIIYGKWIFCETPGMFKIGSLSFTTKYDGT